MLHISLLVMIRGNEPETAIFLVFGVFFGSKGSNHYANTSMQYTGIFHGCKNVHFQIKNFFIFFLIFAQNIDCGYTLEPPH